MPSQPKTFRAAFGVSVANSKWLLLGEFVVNASGYAYSAYLWATGAASWKVMLAVCLSAALSIVMTYYHGKKAWEAEHERANEQEAVIAQIMDGRPRLVFDRAVYGPSVAIYPQQTFGDSHLAAVWQLWFRNQPRSHSGVAAMGVIVEVEFLDGVRSLCRFDGMWARTKAPNDVEWIDLHHSAHFSPLVEAAKLALLVETGRIISDGSGNKRRDLYALSNDTVEAIQNRATPHPSFDLSEARRDSLTVNVRIQGENVSALDFRFHIRRRDDGSVEAIEQVTNG